jgi:hypothetical protein
MWRAPRVIPVGLFPIVNSVTSRTSNRAFSSRPAWSECDQARHRSERIDPETAATKVHKLLAGLALRPIFKSPNQLGMQLAWKVISQSDFDLFFLEPLRVLNVRQFQPCCGIYEGSRPPSSTPSSPNPAGDWLCCAAAHRLPCRKRRCRALRRGPLFLLQASCTGSRRGIEPHSTCGKPPASATIAMTATECRLRPFSFLS